MYFLLEQERQNKISNKEFNKCSLKKNKPNEIMRNKIFEDCFVKNMKTIKMSHINSLF